MNFGKKEKEVSKVKYTRDISFLEAHKIAETNFPIRFYAKGAKRAMNTEALDLETTSLAPSYANVA